MRRDQLTADAALLFVAAIWGATFVMVQDAVTGFPVFAFLAMRFSLASLALLPFLLRSRPAPPAPVPRPAASTRLAAALPGILIGAALFAGYAFQTFGLRETTPAKAGFITGMSVVLVPLGQAIFLRRPPRRNSLIGVALAAIGLALLSLQADLTLSRGDLLVLACAMAFAAHILLMGRYAPDWQPLRLAFVQIVTVALLSAAAALLLEQPIGRPAGGVWFAAAFTGLLATALAFFAQSRAQQATSPTHTALIFASEPIFAGLFSFLLIGELLGPRQLAGSALIVAGMVISEVRTKRDGR
ncbi:MAG TPA: DMT family transporter [Anaerolineae bacterium]|nr:DMT family transporter [Anaerolineae bacterium]HNU05958.1 DMT family transporter [Anaerolineae bacterium]